MLENQCTNMKDLQKIHAHLIKTGLANETVAASRVLAFCASPAGDINYAYMVFRHIHNPNLFIWNTIIRGFSNSSNPEAAISLFIDMLVTSTVHPQRLTYPSVFKAYAQLGLAHEGAQLHGRVVKLGLESDQFVRNTIIHMYSNCGLLSEARRVFDEDLEFDIVAWNSMIMGLSKCGEVGESRRLNGMYTEALDLFGEMQKQKIKPSEFTMVSLLNASAQLGAIRQGEWIHEYIRKNHIQLNPIAVTAIINMYSKCGSIEKAVHVFEAAPRTGLSCWNSIIMGLATNGCEEEAIELFSRLESLSFVPDDVSFLGVLTACSHSGMVEKARKYFSVMRETYRIAPSIKHYSCMVDVLGRAGLLEEVEKLIDGMPLKADAIIWGSLLSSCRKHRDVEMAKRAAKHVIELDPSDSCGYVLMSNVYAASSQFEEAMHERLSMKEQKIEKEPGCSLIEVDGEVHEFIAGGRLHQKAPEIYSLLNGLGFMLERNATDYDELAAYQIMEKSNY
ncbi:hypothetical protein ACLB2K_067179 [Fragaria x ananassa]